MGRVRTRAQRQEGLETVVSPERLSLSPALGIFALGFLTIGQNILAIVSFGSAVDAPLWAGLALVVSTTLFSICGHLAYAVTISTRPVVEAHRKCRRWIGGGLGVNFNCAARKVATYKN